MSYTHKALRSTWPIVLGLVALIGSGVVGESWVPLLVGASLVMPALMAVATPDLELAVERADAQPAGERALFRLRAIMRQGTAASLPAVWERYATIDAARAAVRGMYSNDRVARVLIVTDEVPPRFVEWVER